MSQTYKLVAIKIFGLIIGFAVSVFMARYFGTDFLAEYHLFINSIQLLTVLSCFGLTQFLVMKIPQFSDLNNKISLSYTKTIFLTVVFSAFLFTLFKSISILKQDSIFNQLVGSAPFLTVVTMVFFTMMIEFQRATSKIVLSEINRQISLKFLFFLLLISASIFQIVVYKPQTVYFCAILGVFLFNYKMDKQTFITLRLASQVKLSKRVFVRIIKSSFVYYQNQILLFLQAGFTILLLGFFSDKQQVALYAVALQLASINTFVFASANIRVAPLISKYHSRDLHSECQLLLRTNSRVVCGTTMLLTLCMYFLAVHLLSLYGEEFILAKNIFLILLGSNMVNALTGPAGLLLEMVGKANIRRNALAINVFFILILSVLLIPKFGAVGLAISVGLPSIIINISCMMYVWLICKYRTFLH